MEFKPKKKLGFGLMRLPRLDPANPADVDVEQVKKMVDLFMEKGFTYFDTAWMYNAFASERVTKTALVERYPRDSFTLATKLNAGFFDTLEGRDEIFNAQLEKTGAGYFDYYLLHGVDSGNYDKFEKLDCFNWLLEKKEQGLIKHAGFSFHDTAEKLEEILTAHPQMEFVQLQINYLDWESKWIQSRACYEVAVKHNIPVIIMEPVKGGTLANVPEEAEQLLKSLDPAKSIPSWAIRFVASLPGVMVVLSGMSTIAQMEDNLSYMENFVPLTEEEMEAVHKTADIITAQIAIPCTGCSYCTDGCPQQIPIPQYFSLYNEIKRENMEKKGWTVTYAQYNSLKEKTTGAGECIQCGQCESMCPQHLTIIDFLKDVSKVFDR